MEKHKPIIGILGGIASGKSSVAASFARLGCGVVDADLVAHQLLKEYDTIKQLKDAFGEEFIRKDGTVDRQKLSFTVFDDLEKVRKINEIIHPPVLDRCNELIYAYNADHDVPAIVLDMPLLMEVGWDKRCDFLVFVDCNNENRQLHTANRSSDAKNILKNVKIFKFLWTIRQT